MECPSHRDLSINYSHYSEYLQYLTRKNTNDNTTKRSLHKHDWYATMMAIFLSYSTFLLQVRREETRCELIYVMSFILVYIPKTNDLITRQRTLNI